ncbi:MAG: ComEC/Rec2 family competence protein [Candidatus Omnitrophota bacterium]|jgi:competence protein ComEC
MRVPFLWIAIALTAGVISGILAPGASLPWLWAWLLLILPLLWHCRGGPAFLGFLMVAVALLGWIETEARYRSAGNAVSKWADSGRMSLEGEVVSVPQVRVSGKKSKIDFILAARNLYQGKSPDGRLLEVRGRVQAFLFQTRVVPAYGDRVRLFGNLEKPLGAANPGNFDYRKYLANRNIECLFRGYGSRCARVVRPCGAEGPVHWLGRVRAALSGRIGALFDPASAGVFKALILGDRKDLSGDLNHAFMKTGTSHLIAVSGMNIVMVVGSFYALLIACRVSQKAAACAGLLGTFAYVLVAGAEVPVARAGWMSGVMFLALLLEREKNAFNTFFFAYSVLVAVDPKCLASVSFQLSFGSVFALMTLLRGLAGTVRWAEVLVQTAAASLGTFPLVIYYFNMFSPSGFAANLLAIPFFHLALILSLMTLGAGSIPFLGTVVAALARFCLDCGLGWIRFWSLVPWGCLHFPAPPLWKMALYYVSLGAAAGISRTRYGAFPWIRAALAGAVLAAAFSFFSGPEKGGFQMTFLSLGNNEAVDVRFEDRSRWLIHAGRGGQSNQGERILAPYLRSRGVRHLSGILLADWSQKHCGGLAALLRDFSADHLCHPRWLPKNKSGEFVRWVPRKVNRVALKPGDRVKSGTAGEIAVLGEVPGGLILLVSSPSFHFLMLPRLDAKTVQVLAGIPEALADVEVLFFPRVAPGEGATLETLTEFVDPAAVIMTRPDPEASDFFRERDIGVWSLQESGALTLRVPDRLEPDSGRKTFSMECFLSGKREILFC